MPEEVVYYVTRFGYLAIFVLVFLQEIGFPNPVPNELLLLFTGYLSFKGLLFLPYAILTAVAADVIGTNILFFLFYNTGTYILAKKPKWFPLSVRTINKLTSKISSGGHLSIFIFRLTPFTRGYASVIAGLLHVKPGFFIPIAILSAVIWASVYVLIGHFIGPSWNIFTNNILRFKYVLAAILILVLIIVFLVYFYRKRATKKLEQGINDL